MNEIMNGSFLLVLFYLENIFYLKATSYEMFSTIIKSDFPDM